MDWIGTLAAIDWQPFLLAAVAILSLVNGLSVLQNNLSDRPDIQIDAIEEGNWVWWSELIDKSGPEEIRRYVFIGNLVRSNVGRRPTSIVSTQLQVKLRNLKTADSPLYNFPQPVIPIENAGTTTLPIMRDRKDDMSAQPLLQPGETSAGLHCFLLGMYGGELWTPKIENGIIPATVEMVGTFGRTYKGKVNFYHVPFEQLETVFPNLVSYIDESLE